MPKYKPKPITRLTSHLLTPAVIQRANRWAKTLPETPPPVDASKPPPPAPTPPRAAHTKKRYPVVHVKTRSEPHKKKIPAATCAKISATLRGRKLSAAHRAKISAGKKGKTLSPAHRARLSAAHQGKTISSATRAKMSAAARGKPKSSAHREAISRAVRGERHPNFRHGLFATPPYPIHTVDDVIRALAEKQARLSALLDQPSDAAGRTLDEQIKLLTLVGPNLSQLHRLMRDRWKSQADADAAEKLLADFMREMEEEMHKEAGREEEKGPPNPADHC